MSGQFNHTLRLILFAIRAKPGLPQPLSLVNKKLTNVFPGNIGQHRWLDVPVCIFKKYQALDGYQLKVAGIRVFRLSQLKQGGYGNLLGNEVQLVKIFATTSADQGIEFH